MAIPSVAVERHRQASPSLFHADNGCVRSWQHDRVGPYHMIVLAIDPLLRSQVGRGEQTFEQRCPYRGVFAFWSAGFEIGDPRLEIRDSRGDLGSYIIRVALDCAL